MINKQFDISALRLAYSSGSNITQLLSEACPDLGRSEIIEIAYDIQSGSYTKGATSNPERLERYANEIHEIIKPYLTSNDLILDCGAGELTTLSSLSKYLPNECNLMACDISLSRLRVGRRFVECHMRSDIAKNLTLFVADMATLPLANNSVDVVLTCHALEPNHGREHDLLKELMRVARRKLLLFEPSWENANEAVRKRMEHHGYVRQLPDHIDALGGQLVSVVRLPHPLNPNNPTFCYVVDLADKINDKNDPLSFQFFQCPLSAEELRNQGSYWWSQEAGWAYPQIEDISCLRQKHAILMSHV